MNVLDRYLADRIEQRKQQNLFRSREILETGQSVEIAINGSRYISFCSNDYLGLAGHPDVRQAVRKAVDRYGLGSGASHLVSGHSQAHHALEDELAEFTGRSRALVFSSGYMANLGVITTLAGNKDNILEDRLNHASLIDAGLFSGATFRRYQHTDMDSLERLLDKAHLPQGNTFIISDGVFSMDGDIAPLDRLLPLARSRDAIVVLDDAHGFGCLGKHGGGSAEHFREQGIDVNEDNLQVLIGTLGKAFGTSGAFIAGSDALIEAMIQFCRPYIYTTAIPAVIAEATRASLKLLSQEHWRREHLATLITRFRESCSTMGYTLMESITPVQGLVLGDELSTLQASAFLKNAGFLVTAIRPPTVPAGTSRLRITFSAEHSEAQLERLLDSLDAMRIKLPGKGA